MTMAILLFILFVLYTIACCMDGPDLKPLWKCWLSKKLEGYANSLHPIDYCVIGNCKYYRVASIDYARLLMEYGRLKREYNDFKNTMLSVPPVEVSLYDIKRIEEAFILREGDLFEARMHEDMAERRGIPSWQIPHSMTVDGIVNRTKETCLSKILDAVKQFVTIEEDRETHFPEIIVRGSLNVGVKRQ